MHWIAVHDLRPTPEGNVAMVVSATGKPLVLSMAQIKHRNGDIIFIDDWLYHKLAPYLVPNRRKSHDHPTAGDGNLLSQPQHVGPLGGSPVS